MATRQHCTRPIAAYPSPVVLDEPTSALDVSLRSLIILLLEALQKRLGLACEVLIARADAPRRALPRNLEGPGARTTLGLQTCSGGSGTDLHADMGAVSAHLLITPDQASLDPEAAGIEIWPVRMPNHAKFERGGIRPVLVGKGDLIVVPHRRNRLVLFEANLFHRTSPGRFKSGYENRRVNITFLYDRLEASSLDRIR